MEKEQDKNMKKEIHNVISHFKTISLHKAYVLKYCCMCGLPISGLTHDLSKFSPVEFLESVKYYTGVKSPCDTERSDKGHSEIFMHHKGRNPHHWEYWIDRIVDGESVAAKMPLKYAIEMFCDYLAAGKVYEKENWTTSSPIDYFMATLHNRIYHEETKNLMIALFTCVKECGISKTCEAIRKNYSLLDQMYNAECSIMGKDLRYYTTVIEKIIN